MELTEFAITKRKWKRKRLKRLKKRLRKKEVRSNMRHWTTFSEHVTDARKMLAMGTMQADTFWKNYAVAQEWQTRHNITWWRSRCVALEHENKLLRDKVRSLAQLCNYRDSQEDYSYHANNGDNDNGLGDDYTESDINNEDLEFNLTEDVLNFFETSERHKREMRQKHESSETEHEEESLENEPFVGAAERTQMRKEEADLLYGDASSKILAMETALQSKMERYEDTANPQYWPNIPLKP